MPDNPPKAGPPIDGTEPICRKESPSAADVIADLRRQLADLRVINQTQGTRIAQLEDEAGSLRRELQAEKDDRAADVERLAREVREAQAAKDDAEAACAAIRLFVATEMEWQGFRSEMMEHDFKATGASAENCRTLVEYLKQFKAGIPGQALLDRLAKVPSAIHAAYLEGWDDREAEGGEILYEAIQDAAWRDSDAAEAAKEEEP